MSTSFFGEKVGQLSMFFWFGGMNTMFVISINRFIAIKYPIRYKDVREFKHFLKYSLLFVADIQYKNNKNCSCDYTYLYMH
jgi:hypothetical protein